MKGLSKATMIIAKIIEVICWIAMVVLWLTQVFAYGADLQGDSDGLI